MIVTVHAARIGANRAKYPKREVCAATIVFRGPTATSSAPTAAMPVGPENRVSAPMMIAMATGSSRLVATPRSTEHQVSRMPRAIIGSGRSPLLSGSQNARNMPAAVHAAARLVFTEWPSRGMTSRLISHQHVSAITSVGSRTQALLVLTCAHSANRS